MPSKKGLFEGDPKNGLKSGTKKTLFFDVFCSLKRVITYFYVFIDDEKKHVFIVHQKVLKMSVFKGP